MKRLNERQERILLSLKKLDYLNRDQINKIHRLGTIRNTNRILKQLSPYLSSYREDYSTIYYLNNKGREYVNSEKIRKKTKFVNHVLMRNDFYIYAGFPREWKNEVELSLGDIKIICDAWFRVNGKYYALEVDLDQTMKENRNKIEKYRKLLSNNAIKESLGHLPTLIWFTTTEFRKKKLIDLCKGLPHAVYTTNDIK
ncbi:replication-relaxation family protein [Neobacillus thermocopriae]|uniref:replication-relaxation family protein n=1 Tax=Neobacillus thermocopriae TaxID=1215031 RepID=UPI002E1F4CEA|nr:replication-relaxation family protein [Neobacillus thermocopriae]MED3714352.1 replication-relaxation family protein [Neobacillus thermocopriae]